MASDPPGVRHFSSPFHLEEDGVPVTVEQDSPEEIGSAVLNVLSCSQHGKLGDPAFGIPPLLFHNLPLNLAGILAAVKRLESRADLSGTQAASTIERTVQAIVGRRLPGATLPGHTFPSAGEIKTLVEGGPGSVDVPITARVRSRPPFEQTHPPPEPTPADTLFPGDSLIP